MKVSRSFSGTPDADEIFNWLPPTFYDSGSPAALGGLTPDGLQDRRYVSALFRYAPRPKSRN